MTHNNETMLRHALDDFAADSLDQYWGHCAADFVLHIPGDTTISGSHIGRDGYYTLLARVLELTDGTFREEVLDVMASEHHGAVLSRHTFERHGATHSYKTVHFYEIRDEQLQIAWELPRDRPAFDAGWR